ncbi:acyl carrier protein [Verrucosispora sp. TAA-831]|uniref:acyl carrier protein n=1 Tax=Verrucosispora sp. TAA-831 TaxID=3422227 RepID=UPI003D6DB1FB
MGRPSCRLTPSLRAKGAQPLSTDNRRTWADVIRRVLREHARLPVSVEKLEEHTDLYHAGMTSLASVSVMLALEDAFDVEFPDHLLTKQTFTSISSIKAALRETTVGGAA